MSTRPGPGGAVALVTQRRIADAGYADFVRWTARTAERLKTWPGFLGQDVTAPQPPAHVDWITVLHFADAGAARAWLQSEERLALLEDILPHALGPEDVHLLPETGRRPDHAVSALISFQVPAEQEAAFLAWQQRIQAAEAEFPGFLRHKIERPIPGLHDDWLVILSFDDDAHLARWLESPERQRLLAKGQAYAAGLSVRRASHGFHFWFPAGQPQPPQGPAFIFKCNLLVLLVLYPVVFLWGHFIGGPLIDARGAPFWLSLFIGNLVSTQLLGWWLVPAAFKAFDGWLAPPAAAGWRRDAAGYALVAGLYLLAMGACAYLLEY